jgi:prepilin-type processing-associated H-X9-DG protein
VRQLQVRRWDLNGGDPGNQAVAAVPVKIFQCPSAPEQDRTMPISGGMGACGDYAPTERVDPVLASMGLIHPVANYKGILELNALKAITDIQDGTANTILLTEDAGRPRAWMAGQAGPDQAVVGCGWSGYNNPLTIKGSTPDGQAHYGPCAINCTNDGELYSFHPGGANAVFGDGSVHFLNAAINIRTLAVLATRAGGEVVSANDY